MFPVPLLGRKVVPAALCMALAVPAAAEIDLRAVTLSTAGLAMIEARAAAGPGGVVVELRREDIDDFLKSVVIDDPSGAAPQLRMPGPAAFEDAFAALPLTPEQVSDPARLLAALAGAPVTVDRRGIETSGAVLGVTENPCDAGVCPVLTLRDASGALRSFALDPELVVRFTDPRDRAVLDAAVQALRLQAGATRIAVRVDSADEPAPEGRDLELRWLQAAPLWKTAWRAVDGPGGLVLTGWAVVENATGQDWHDISLTLATGEVQALYAGLYDRVRPPRETADPVAPAFDLPMAETTLGRALAAVDHAVAAVAADDGASFTRFTLAQPVTLEAGGMVSLPFLREVLPDARRLIYRGGSGAPHPMLALDLTNPTPLRLPAGILTLYEDGRGHAGDARVPELLPGGTALVEFARDTAVRISEAAEASERVRDLRISDGVMRLTEDIERRTLYRIQGAEDGTRTVTLDHPITPGWTIVTAEGSELFDAMRWELEVPAAAIISHEVLERQPRIRRIAVTDLDAEALSLWSRQAPDAEARTLLETLAELRAEITALRTEAARLREHEADLTAEQARLVDLIVALGAESDATRARRARVDAIDDEIAAAVAGRRAAQDRVDDLRARVAALIGG